MFLVYLLCLGYLSGSHLIVFRPIHHFPQNLKIGGADRRKRGQDMVIVNEVFNPRLECRHIFRTKSLSPFFWPIVFVPNLVDDYDHLYSIHDCRMEL